MKLCTFAGYRSKVKRVSRHFTIQLNVKGENKTMKRFLMGILGLGLLFGISLTAMVGDYKIENLQSRQKYLSDQKKASEAKGIKGFFERLMTPGSITPWTKEKENTLKQINKQLEDKFSG
jgi:hypothetical protein